MTHPVPPSHPAVVIPPAPEPQPEEQRGVLDTLGNAADIAELVVDGLDLVIGLLE